LKIKVDLIGGGKTGTKAVTCGRWTEVGYNKNEAGWLKLHSADAI